MDKNTVEQIIGPVHEVVDRSKGVDQQVSIVTSEQGKFVVKIPEDHTKLENERLGCELCSKHEIPAPQVIFVNDTMLIETYIEGTDLDEMTQTREQYVALGALLRKLHSIEQKRFGAIIDNVGEHATQTENVNSWFPDEFNRFKEKFPELAQPAHEYFEKHRKLMESEKPVTLHGDIADYNIVIGDGVSIIDFGDLSAGPAMQDFSFMYIDHYGDEFFEALLEGYGEHDLEKIKFYAFLWMTWLLSGDDKQKDRMLHLYKDLLSESPN